MYEHSDLVHESFPKPGKSTKMAVTQPPSNDFGNKSGYQYDSESLKGQYDSKKPKDPLDSPIYWQAG